MTEGIVEELISLHASSRTFRQAFSFKPIMAELVSLLRTLLSKGLFILPEGGSISNLLDRSLHFATLVFSDDALDSSHKREVSQDQTSVKNLRLNKALSWRAPCKLHVSLHPCTPLAPIQREGQSLALCLPIVIVFPTRLGRRLCPE